MLKYHRSLLLLVAIGLFGCSAAYAGIPATASLFSFDPSTSTYVYEVIQGVDATDTLSDFGVQAYTGVDDVYAMSSPSTGGSWQTYVTYWDPINELVEYQWNNGFVKPGRFLGGVPWVGYFTVQVPGTQPVPGRVWVMGAQQEITFYSVNVPGFVPEPSGIIALGTMLLGIGPVALRFRKR